jgi:hypothetical protein
MNGAMPARRTQCPNRPKIKSAGAHQLWEAAGKPDGRDQEFWIEAERQLAQDTVYNPDETSDRFLE